MVNTEQQQALTEALLESRDPVKRAMGLPAIPLRKVEELLLPLIPTNKNPAISLSSTLAPSTVSTICLLSDPGKGKSTFWRDFCARYGLRYLPVNVSCLPADTGITVPPVKVVGMRSIAEHIVFSAARDDPGSSADDALRAAINVNKSMDDEERRGLRTAWVDALYDDVPTLVVLEEVLDIDPAMMQLVRALLSNRAIDGDRISDKVLFVATANPPKAGGSSREQPPAFLDRFRFKRVETDFEDWMDFMFRGNNGRGEFIDPSWEGDTPRPIQFLQGFFAYAQEQAQTAPSWRSLTGAAKDMVDMWMWYEQKNGPLHTPTGSMNQEFSDRCGEVLGSAMFQYCEHGNDPLYRVITTDQYLRADESDQQAMRDRAQEWRDKKMMMFLSAAGFDMKCHIRVLGVNKDNLKPIIGLLARMNSDTQVDVLRLLQGHELMPEVLQELKGNPDNRELYKQLQSLQSRAKES